MDTTNLTQVSDNNGLLGQYGYSGDGLRVGKTTAAGAGYFVYDGDRVLQETDQNGLTTATYTSTAGSAYAPLVSIMNSAGSHVPLPDALGSVRVLLDAGQNLTDGYAFEGFGSQVSGGGSTPNSYRYVGLFGYYEDQETGLCLLSARYYDSVAGRFLTRDPIGYAGGDWGLYGYVGGGVTRRKDPRGLQGIFGSGLTQAQEVSEILMLAQSARWYYDKSQRDFDAGEDEFNESGLDWDLAARDKKQGDCHWRHELSEAELWHRHADKWFKQANAEVKGVRHMLQELNSYIAAWHLGTNKQLINQIGDLLTVTGMWAGE